MLYSERRTRGLPAARGTNCGDAKCHRWSPHEPSVAAMHGPGGPSIAAALGP